MRESWERFRWEPGGARAGGVGNLSSPNQHTVEERGASDITRTELPDGWMERQLRQDMKTRKKIIHFLHIRVFRFLSQMLISLLIYI